MPEKDMFCPLHSGLSLEISEIKKKQDARKCLTNESDIKHLQQDIGEIKQTDNDQWTRINKLQWYVAMGAGGAGVLAFVGSVIGAWIFKR